MGKTITISTVNNAAITEIRALSKLYSLHFQRMKDNQVPTKWLRIQNVHGYKRLIWKLYRKNYYVYWLNGTTYCILQILSKEIKDDSIWALLSHVRWHTILPFTETKSWNVVNQNVANEPMTYKILKNFKKKQKLNKTY